MLEVLSAGSTARGVSVSDLALLAVGDPGRTRTVYAAIAFLVALGVGLSILAAWLVRSTRVDPELLAPLELMGDRAWRAGDPVWQRRRLDEVRPAGAEPLERMAPPPVADPEFDRGPALGDFSDFDDLLRELGVEVDEVAPVAPAPELSDEPPPMTVVEVDAGPEAPSDGPLDADPGTEDGDPDAAPARRYDA